MHASITYIPSEATDYVELRIQSRSTPDLKITISEYTQTKIKLHLLLFVCRKHKKWNKSVLCIRFKSERISAAITNSHKYKTGIYLGVICDSRGWSSVIRLDTTKMTKLGIMPHRSVCLLSISCRWSRQIVQSTRQTPRTFGEDSFGLSVTDKVILFMFFQNPG